MTAAEIAQRVTAAKAKSPLWDRDVLGDLVQPCDDRAPWVNGNNNYVWWHLLGLIRDPKSLLEIGTRFGYSVWSVVTAAGRPPLDLTITVYDAEIDDDKEPLAVFEGWFRSWGVKNLHVHRKNTQELSELDVPGPVDWATVDADHSYKGALHDCRLVWPCIAPGGILVVDDTNPGAVQDAAEAFAREVGVDFAFLPSLRGMHVLVKPI